MYVTSAMHSIKITNYVIKNEYLESLVPNVLNIDTVLNCHVCMVSYRFGFE